MTIIFAVVMWIAEHSTNDAYTLWDTLMWTIVKYATTGLANQLFVSKYQLYLPDEKALRHEVQRILEQE